MSMPKIGDQLCLIATSSLGFMKRTFETEDKKKLDIVFCPSSKFQQSEYRLREEEVYRVKVININDSLKEKGTIRIHVDVEERILVHSGRDCE